MTRSLHVVAALAVLSFASSARAAPQVTHSQPIEPASVTGVYLGDFRATALAADEHGNFLGVFRQEANSYSYLYGARVRADGTVIDRQPFTITSRWGTGEFTNPRVAYNGGRFLVAWETKSSGWDIEGAFVEAATHAVTGPFAIAATSRIESEVDVAGIADRFVAVYTSRTGSDSDIYATDVFLNGTVSAPYVVYTDFGGGMTQLRRPAIAASRQGFLYIALAGQVESEPTPDFKRDALMFIRTVGVDPRVVAESWAIDGSPLTYQPYYCGLDGRPDIASLGFEGAAVAKYVCKDSKSHAELWKGIYFSAPVGRGRWFMPITSGYHSVEEHPSIAAIEWGLEPGYWVTWLGREDADLEVLAQNVDAAGKFLVGSPIVLGPGLFKDKDRHIPAIASNGGEVLVAWDDDDFKRREAVILGTRITADGTVLDGKDMLILNQDPANYAIRQHGVAVARNENGRALAVWHEHRMIRGAVIDLGSGAPVIGPFDIGDSDPDLTPPAVASDGKDFLVVWEAPYHSGYTGGILAQLVDEDGNFAAGKKYLTNERSRNAAVAYSKDRNAFFAAWRSKMGGMWYPAGCSVKIDGSSLDVRPWDKFGTEGLHDGRPAIAASKENFVIVWEVNDQGSIDPINLFATTILADDKPTGEVEITQKLDDYWGPHEQSQPAVDCMGDTCLVLLRCHETGQLGDIWAIRLHVQPDPAPDHWQKAITQKHDEGRPSLIFDGTQFAAMWETDVDGFPAVWFSRFDDVGNLQDGPEGVKGVPGTFPALTWDKTDHFILVNERSLRGVERAWVTKLD